MFEDVCRAGGVYSERVSGRRDLPAAIEHSLTVSHTETRHALLNIICRV
jgi:hypothetical protein